MGTLLTPKQIVHELDRYIIGQDDAKKAVAVAIRNRYRRGQLPEEERDEIIPKNILMKGPTGVGKTEIARRLAKLVKAPFIKVEATKYTEVGYVGKDVESMIRDLAEEAVRLVKEEKLREVEIKTKSSVEKRIVEALTPIYKAKNTEAPAEVLKQEILRDLQNGKADDIVIEINIADMPRPVEVMPGSGAEIDIGSMFGGFFQGKKKVKKMTVKNAIQIITAEEADKLIDNDQVNIEALKRAEQDGIVFIDEIDKIAGSGGGHNVDVSRSGVQRDILPIVEGCTVRTKYGNLKTDFILFIAAGAFHMTKVDDLIPELQGRFPVSVDLVPLTKEDFYNILSKPENAITKQYATLLRVDNLDIAFTDDALMEIAEIAAEENNSSENIGARRLHTVMEQLLADVSFNAGGDHPLVHLKIDGKYVSDKIGKKLKSRNLRKHIL